MHTYQLHNDIIQDQNASIFDYQVGFISKVSNTPLSSDAVNLRLENIKQLLDNGDIETESENDVPEAKEDSHEEGKAFFMVYFRLIANERDMY